MLVCVSVSLVGVCFVVNERVWVCMCYIVFVCKRV